MSKIGLMIMDARGNAYAYRILSEKYESAREALQNGDKKDTKEIELSFPMAMSLTFSCELYLKILILKKGLSYNREHDLFSLYNILNEDIKSKILECYKKLNGNDTDFDKKLEESKNAFKEWRYYYEIDLSQQPCGFYVVDIPFLDMLLQCLEEVYDSLLTTSKKEDESKKEALDDKIKNAAMKVPERVKKNSMNEGNSRGERQR